MNENKQNIVKDLERFNDSVIWYWRLLMNYKSQTLYVEGWNVVITVQELNIRLFHVINKLNVPLSFEGKMVFSISMTAFA